MNHGEHTKFEIPVTTRAEISGISLTEYDAAIIKGMLARGDRQHDIAAWFGVNGGRIAEISKGDKFSNVPLQTDNLPPSGPYLSGKGSEKVKTELRILRQKTESLLKHIDNIHRIVC